MAATATPCTCTHTDVDADADVDTAADDTAVDEETKVDHLRDLKAAHVEASLVYYKSGKCFKKNRKAAIASHFARRVALTIGEDGCSSSLRIEIPVWNHAYLSTEKETRMSASKAQEILSRSPMFDDYYVSGVIGDTRFVLTRRV